ncbi:MAG: hypothetical protein M3O06_10945 [Pseudomonadota bacterium]|nr:hypothetical protein [Pseudomonadota bacterium]
MKAFSAAAHDAFTLIVDCPVRLKSGLAIDHSVFIDNGTSVEFTGAGKFVVDNMFHPAFVIASSSNINLINWNVEWEGNVPMNPNFGGYELNGRFVGTPGSTQPAGAFNDLVLTPWLTAHRGVTFLETRGWVKSYWVGGVNPAAVFFLTGDTSNVVFAGLKLYVPPSVGCDHFIPMAFSSSPNWKGGQTVDGSLPYTTQYLAVPHHVTFSGLDLDGVLMGWQGTIQDSLFENITSHRYGDLQDSNGGTLGGIGKWFPPPHLFYLNTHSDDRGLDNVNVHFHNIVDEGIRVGVARDKGGGDSVSGYANSLKLGCTQCSVDTYTSHRPDGFMDVLESDGLTVSNVVATFDSQFINNAFPAGLRFPQNAKMHRNYHHITFQNVQMTDTAYTTVRGPIGNAPDTGNSDLVFKDFQVTLNKWGGSSEMTMPTFGGSNNAVSLKYTMAAQAVKVAFSQQSSMLVYVKATPAVVHPGATSTIMWSTRNAGNCSASGAWSGAVGNSGSRGLSIGSAGNYDYNLTCQNSGATGATTMRVVAQ